MDEPLNVGILVDRVLPLQQNREIVKCFRCGGIGHFRSECYLWKTRMCVHWRQGCCRDANCSFAHGTSELRSQKLPTRDARAAAPATL